MLISHFVCLVFPPHWEEMTKDVIGISLCGLCADTFFWASGLKQHERSVCRFWGVILHMWKKAVQGCRVQQRKWHHDRWLGLCVVSPPISRPWDLCMCVRRESLFKCLSMCVITPLCAGESVSFKSYVWEGSRECVLASCCTDGSAFCCLCVCTVHKNRLKH